MPGNRAAEILAYNRVLVRQEAILERDLVALYASIADDIAAHYSAAAPHAVLDRVAQHRPAIEQLLSRNLLQTALIFGQMLHAKLEAAGKSYGYIETSPRAGIMRTVFPGWEAKLWLDVFQSTIRAWVLGHALDRAVTVYDTYRDTVADVIQQSIDDGTGEAGTAKAIVEVVGRAFSRVAAARIARTEVHTAASVGADTAAQSTGLELVKEWAAVEDHRTRLDHAVADTQTVAMDETFLIGTTRMKYPGDPAAPAREIVNCRCVPLYHPVIGGQVLR